jgi:hypothetical protein
MEKVFTATIAATNVSDKKNLKMWNCFVAHAMLGNTETQHRRTYESHLAGCLCVVKPEAICPANPTEEI